MVLVVFFSLFSVSFARHETGRTGVERSFSIETALVILWSYIFVSVSETLTSETLVTIIIVTISIDFV